MSPELTLKGEFGTVMVQSRGLYHKLSQKLGFPRGQIPKPTLLDLRISFGWITHEVYGSLFIQTHVCHSNNNNKAQILVI